MLELTSDAYMCIRILYVCERAFCDNENDGIVTTIAAAAAVASFFFTIDDIKCQFLFYYRNFTNIISHSNVTALNGNTL